jgi:hypothetical protein
LSWFSFRVGPASVDDAPTEEGVRQCSAIDVFEFSAKRHAVRDSACRNLVACRHLGEIVSGGITFDGGVGRTDHFLELLAAEPLVELAHPEFFRKWPTSTPEESDRRAIYILTKRSFRFPTLSAFDLPDNISSCGQRDITTIPNQALTLLNNHTIRQQADAFAKRLLRETNGDPGAVAVLAWRYAYGRNITGEEKQQAVEFMQSRSQTASAKGMAARPAVEELCLALFNTNEFIYMQ